MFRVVFIGLIKSFSMYMTVFIGLQRSDRLLTAHDMFEKIIELLNVAYIS